MPYFRLNIVLPLITVPARVVGPHAAAVVDDGVGGRVGGDAGDHEGFGAGGAVGDRVAGDRVVRAALVIDAVLAVVLIGAVTAQRDRALAHEVVDRLVEVDPVREAADRGSRDRVGVPLNVVDAGVVVALPVAGDRRAVDRISADLVEADAVRVPRGHEGPAVDDRRPRPVDVDHVVVAVGRDRVLAQIERDRLAGSRLDHQRDAGIACAVQVADQRVRGRTRRLNGVAARERRIRRRRGPDDCEHHANRGHGDREMDIPPYRHCTPLLFPNFSRSPLAPLRIRGNRSHRRDISAETRQRQRIARYGRPERGSQAQTRESHSLERGNEQPAATRDDALPHLAEVLSARQYA